MPPWYCCNKYCARTVWLSSLRSTNHGAISRHLHDHILIRELVKRRIRPDSLTTCDKKWVAHRINGDTLLGLNIWSLRHITFNKCDVGDEGVISIADSCPHLTEIRLFDCDCVTGTSLIALGKYSYQLIFIDIGRIWDRRITAFADARCENSAVNLSDIQLGYPVTRIRISYSDQITDIDISALGCSCPI